MPSLLSTYLNQISADQVATQAAPSSRKQRKGASIFSVCLDQITRPSFLVDLEQVKREKQHVANKQTIIEFLKKAKTPLALESIAESTDVCVRDARNVMKELQTEGLATLKGKRLSRQKFWVLLQQDIRLRG